MDCVKCGDPDASMALRDESSIGDILGYICSQCFREAFRDARRGRCSMCKDKATIGTSKDLGTEEDLDIEKGNLDVSLNRPLFCEKHYEKISS